MQSAEFTPPHPKTPTHMTIALFLAFALHPCGDASRWYCGRIARPLDPTGAIRDSLNIHFEWLPHRNTNEASKGVIVANEGGPGSGSTGTRESYRTLFGPLLAGRDLLLMDNRGTGSSGAIDCEPLQSEPVMTYAAIKACGGQLGNRATLFGTGVAADDLAAILDSLHVKKADLYGDSYGTFFVQTFAGRHPDRVRSLILDGAFPVLGDSPWYETESAAMRRAYDLVCRRSAACRTLPGSSMDRITRLISEARKLPIQATIVVERKPRHISMAPSSIATIMDASGLATVPYRELDAAARAFHEDADVLPLLRLVAESYAVNEDAGSAQSYSRGLFMAVSCADYPQAYDMRLDPASRQAGWLDALAQERNHAPNAFAPFTIDEWLSMAPDYSTVKLCLDWPAQSGPYPPGQPVPPTTKFPAVPTLVISGDLDTITTAAEGKATAALFPSARQVVEINGAHVDAIDDPYDCASRIARRFVETLDAGNTQCLTHIPEVRMVPMFARRVDQLPQSTRQLRAANAALQAVGDALARTSWLTRNGSGLRGGTYTRSASGNLERIRLTGYRWTQDLPVSGTITMDGHNGTVHAAVKVSGASRGMLSMEWNTLRPNAQAAITGTLDGLKIHETAYAP
jgi:pimeloyl-ACP methyl ester carboxylesterase